MTRFRFANAVLLVLLLSAYAMTNDVNDVAFINALIDTISARYPIESRRIYVTEMSNGAMMSHRVSRELSRRVAAIAPVVGAVFGDEPTAASPVSAIMIDGLKDTSVPPEGGPPGGIGRSQWSANPRPNLEQGAYWARVDRCRQPKRETVTQCDERELDVRAARTPVGSTRFHQLAQGADAVLLSWRRALPAFPFRDRDGPHSCPTFHERDGWVTVQDDEIHRVPPAAVDRRIGTAHLPDTGRKHSFTEWTLAEEVFRRRERHNQRVIRLGAESMGGGKTEIEAASWPIIANHFPAILNFAVAKYDQRLVAILVEDAEGELT